MTFLARALAYLAPVKQPPRRPLERPKMLNDLHGAELHGRLERALRKYLRAEFLIVDDFAILDVGGNGTLGHRLRQMIARTPLGTSVT